MSVVPFFFFLFKYNQVIQITFEIEIIITNDVLIFKKTKKKYNNHKKDLTHNLMTVNHTSTLTQKKDCIATIPSRRNNNNKRKKKKQYFTDFCHHQTN